MCARSRLGAGGTLAGGGVFALRPLALGRGERRLARLLGGEVLGPYCSQALALALVGLASLGLGGGQSRAFAGQVVGGIALDIGGRSGAGGCGRRRGGRRAHGARARPREIDQPAAPDVERERRARAEQRLGRGERGAPRRRVGAAQRRRLVGSGQRRQPVGAPTVVDDEHRRREPLAHRAVPAAGDPKQRSAWCRPHQLEARNLEAHAHPLARESTTAPTRSAVAVERRREHRVGRRGRVDHDEPFGVLGRQRVVGVGDRGEERVVLALEAVGLRRRGRPGAHGRPPGRCAAAACGRRSGRRSRTR